MVEPKKVLLVDDDVELTELLSLWLQRDGYDVVSCTSGERALEILSRTFVDVMILDMNLPGISGVESLARVRKTHPHLPVVVLTSNTRVDRVVAAMQQGAYDYLVKPHGREQLLSTIGHAVAQQERSARFARLARQSTSTDYAGIVGESPAMKALFEELDRLVACDISVLIRGESGTGKELVARALHECSGRSSGPFVALNCAAIPEGLQESELFGHEKGAFTGATTRRVGKFEAADGGTVFLDEVAELQPSAQGRMLRVLQERKFSRVGCNFDIASDFRLICASHQALSSLVQSGSFREDLFYRLAVYEIEIPPLRDRGDDVVLLAQRFVADSAARFGVDPPELSEGFVDALRRYTWPGNVRELQNAMSRGVVAAQGETLLTSHLPLALRADGDGRGLRSDPAPAMPAAAPAAESRDASGPSVRVDASEGDFPTLDDAEKALVVAALERADGNVTEACRLLGTSRTTFYRKLDRYGLRDGQ